MTTPELISNDTPPSESVKDIIQATDRPVASDTDTCTGKTQLGGATIAAPQSRAASVWHTQALSYPELSNGDGPCPELVNDIIGTAVADAPESRASTAPVGTCTSSGLQTIPMTVSTHSHALIITTTDLGDPIFGCTADWSKQCSACNAPPTGTREMIQCPHCRVRYCSKRCQKQHKAQHSTICSQGQALAAPATVPGAISMIAATREGQIELPFLLDLGLSIASSITVEGHHIDGILSRAGMRNLRAEPTCQLQFKDISSQGTPLAEDQVLTALCFGAPAKLRNMAVQVLISLGTDELRTMRFLIGNHCPPGCTGIVSLQSLRSTNQVFSIGKRVTPATPVESQSLQTPTWIQQTGQQTTEQQLKQLTQVMTEGIAALKTISSTNSALSETVYRHKTWLNQELQHIKRKPKETPRPSYRATENELPGPTYTQETHRSTTTFLHLPEEFIMSVLERFPNVGHRLLLCSKTLYAHGHRPMRTIWHLDPINKPTLRYKGKLLELHLASCRQLQEIYVNIYTPGDLKHTPFSQLPYSAGHLLSTPLSMDRVITDCNANIPQPQATLAQRSSLHHRVWNMSVINTLTVFWDCLWASCFKAMELSEDLDNDIQRQPPANSRFHYISEQIGAGMFPTHTYSFTISSVTKHITSLFQSILGESEYQGTTPIASITQKLASAQDMVVAIIPRHVRIYHCLKG